MICSSQFIRDDLDQVNVVLEEDAFCYLLRIQVRDDALLNVTFGNFFVRKLMIQFIYIFLGTDLIKFDTKGEEILN